MGRGGGGFGLLVRCYAPAQLSDSESYSESICCFWVPGNLSGRVLTGEKDRWENGGGRSLTSRCLLFVRSSLEAFGGCLVQQRGVEATEKELRGHPQTKRKQKRTSLQVNSERQLAGSWGKLRFQTINHHSLLKSNKAVAYSTTFTSRKISSFVLCWSYFTLQAYKF